MKNIPILESQLEALNQAMVEQNIFTTVILIGGFAGRFLLDGYRQTLDIDFLLSSIDDNSKYDIWRELLFSRGMEEVSVVEVPPVEDIEPFATLTYSNLKVIVPTVEYFAVTKIFSDRKKDEEDLVQQGILAACDPKKLQQMLDEYKDYVLNPNSFNSNYVTLKEVLKSYGITTS
ncbi:DUF6036 family nucleotidyltransferase [Enterococcus hulanensis]|uniref:DUF6036 family nucleotidyltransferase n=1 Tax=Enterococcus hulanensis TaxID=2559929 RepID=UPI0010FA0E88|nr:DUF6036 family nucleotidyltransferase [Enterococcus hulanensis]